MIAFLRFLLFLVLCCSSLFGSLVFEPNRGQTDASVRYLARTPKGAVFVTDAGLVFNKNNIPVRIGFADADNRGAWAGEEPTGHTTHYFIGRDRSKWVRGLPSYRRLVCKNLYPGVDLVLYGNSRDQLEYDLILAPGADPSQIRIEPPADAVIDPTTGDLVMAGGAIRQHRPVILQENRVISGRIRERGAGRYGFEIAGYDKKRKLTIDPVIESREYLGGIGEDSITTIGILSMAGTTTSIDFPGSPGPRHGTDVFLRNDELQVTVVMGGSGNETAAPAFGLNMSGTSILGGVTDSRDLPTDIRNEGRGDIQFFFDADLKREYQGGRTDGFFWVFRSWNDQSAGFQMGYIGTAGDDAITATSETWVTGFTNGTGLLASNAAPQAQAGGGTEGFLMRLGPGDNSISVLQRTYLGGRGDDWPRALAVRGGEVIVAGETASSNFPIVGGSAQRSGPTDAFVARFGIRNLSLAIRSSTLVGGSGSEHIASIAWVSIDRPILFAGTTSSTNLAQVKPIQTAYGGGDSDAFFGILSPDRLALRQLGYVGGSGTDEGLASAIDWNGNAFVGGRTRSRDLPVQDPSQNGFAGGLTDGFAAFIESTGSVGFVTYYGGSGDDEILAMGEAIGGGVTVAGSTTSTDLPGPASLPALDNRRIGSREGFVARLASTRISIQESTAGARGYRGTVGIRMSGTAAMRAAGGLTAESSDPGRVLVTFSHWRGFATPTDTVLWTTPQPPTLLAYECLTDTGDAVVTVRAAGFETRRLRVYCGQPELSFPDLTLVPQNSLRQSVGVTVTNPATGEKVRMPFRAVIDQGTPPRIVSVVSSDPGNIRIEPGYYMDTFPIPAFVEVSVASGSQTGEWTITASAPGHVTSISKVTVLARPSSADPTETPAEADYPAVVPAPLGDFDLGKDLMSYRYHYLSTPIPDGATVTVSTSTPSLVQLQSYFGFGPVESSVPAAVDHTRRRIGFNVHGLAAQGTAKVTLQISGQSSIEINVRMRPAGFLWRRDSYDYPMDLSREITAGPVDTATGALLGIQRFRSGFTRPQPPIAIADPQVATVEGSRVVQRVTTGNTILTIQQPAGFATPGILQRARLVLKEPEYFALINRVVILGRGTITGAIPCSVSPCVRLALDEGTLTAVPEPGHVFAGWVSGCTNSSNPICTLPTYPGDDIVARFVPEDGPLAYVPVGPCRLVDTRNPAGALGGPALPARTTRNFPIRGACSMPQTAMAYSLNITVVPKGSLGYLSVWAGDKAQPLVSTLNALDGRVKANAAIVPAGRDGSIHLYSTDPTDVIIDVNGVFVPPGSSGVSSESVFYSTPPCRIYDSRTQSPGGGMLRKLETRRIQTSRCGIPNTASAVALNATAIPKSQLGFLSLLREAPSGVPSVSTLNALTGAVTANQAIQPLSGGDFYAFVDNDADVVFDVTGYFAEAGGLNALSFRTLNPCRILDTRLADGPFGGPVMPPLAARDFSVTASSCGVPTAAKAYSLSATVVPAGLLGYLTLYPAGAVRPTVSTLNAVDGSIASNAAIVPAGINGGISAFVTERTHLILDINGYFAP